MVFRRWRYIPSDGQFASERWIVCITNAFTSDTIKKEEIKTENSWIDSCFDYSRALQFTFASKITKYL